MSIKIIAAVSQNGVMGNSTTNSIPWSYPEDMKFFRAMTGSKMMTNATTSTVIMGRKTFQSIGKPLPKRRNIIITKSKIDGVDCFPTLELALANDHLNAPPEQWEGDLFSKQSPSVWLIGGASIYREGLQYADEIFLTLIPEVVEGDVFFPWISPAQFEIKDYIPLEREHGALLQVAHYIKRQ